MAASSRSPRLTRRFRRSALWKSGLGMVSAVACACFAGTAGAQTYYYWDGNGATTGAGTNAQNVGTWGTSPFWSTDATGNSATSATGPGAGDFAVFTAFDNVPANNPTGGYTVTLGSAQSVLGLIIGPTTYNATYQGNDGTLTLAGTGAPGLTIGTGGVTLNGSNGDPTFAASIGTITLAGDQTWNINNAHVIATAAAVAGNATNGNTRTWTLGYVNAFTSTISGVVSNGTAGGTLGLTLNNVNATGNPATLGTIGGGTWSITGVANTYTGATTISAGNLQFASLANTGTASSLGAGGTITLGTGTTNNATLTYVGTTASTTDRTVNLGGTTGGGSIINNSSAATSTLSFTSAMTNTGSGAKTLTLGGSNLGANNFGGAIVDSAGGNLTLAKTGVGFWSLGGANTYSGGTNITGGTLSVGAAGTLGSNIAGNNITISGGNLLLSAATNFGANQNIVLNSGGIGVAYTPAAPPTITDNTGTTGGVYGINYTGTGGVTSEASGSLYSGYFFLGSFSAGTYTGASLGAGNVIAGSTSGATGAYRLGGGGGTLNFQNAGILTGNNDLLAGGTGGGNVILPGGNTYTGQTTIQNGVLTVSSLNRVVGGTTSSSLGAPTTAANGTITVGGGANTATLNYAGAGETTDRVINVAGSGGTAVLQNSGTGAVGFSSAPSFKNTGAETLQLGAATDTFGGTIGAITDSTAATAKVSVGKAGVSNSTWTIGTSTYTGNTIITGGVLASPTVLASSPLITLNGASATSLAILQTNGTLARTISTSAGLNLQSNGGFAAQGGKLTVTLGNTAVAYGVQGFFPNNGTLAFGSTTADNQVEFTNGLSLAAGDAFQRAIFVEKGVGGDSALLSGIITNTPANTTSNPGIIKQGRGTLILSGANTFSGVVTVSAGTLVAAGNSTGTTSGVFGTGTGPSGAPTASSPIIIGDNNTGSGGNPAILLGGAFTVDRKINIGDNGTNNTFSIGGSTDNTSTFSGLITSTTGNTPANANTFSVTQVATTGANTLNISGGIAVNKLVNFNNVGAVSVNTVGISGAGAVTKTNTGLLTFAVTNTYAGTTGVNGGTLLVNGSTAGGVVTVGNGATLGGGGTVGGATTISLGGNITAATTGTVGTLAMTSTLTLATGSRYLVDIGAGGTSDKLSITGAFLSNGATIQVNSGTLDGTSTYIIASYASDTGSTFSLAGAPNYQLLDTGTLLELVPAPVPEPATWAVMASFAGLGAVIRARRKRSNC